MPSPQHQRVGALLDYKARQSYTAVASRTCIARRCGTDSGSGLVGLTSLDQRKASEEPIRRGSLGPERGSLGPDSRTADPHST